MKTLRPLLFTFAIAALLCTAAPRSADAHPGVSFEFFYDNLSPYGEWVEVPEYGYCWLPSGVDGDWSPYSDGYWAYTDAGWTWVSYEDFGWITYHYGRWVRVWIEFGSWHWVWVPDYEWAPAWVSWRHGGGYIGWAPLTPRCRFRPEIGFSTWVDTEYDIGPSYYSFCEIGFFGSPVLRPVIIDRSRNITIINNTVNITNITVNNGVVYTGGPNYQLLAHQTKKPIPVLKLERLAEAGKGGKAVVAGGKLVLHAPKIDPPTGNPKPAKIAKVIEKARIDTGWEQVKDPKVKAKIEEKFKKDAKGLKPDNAPAKPVSEAEVKFVHEKAKGGGGGESMGKKGTETGTPPAGGPVTTEKVEKGDKRKKGETTAPLTPFVAPSETGTPGGGDKHKKPETFSEPTPKMGDKHNKKPETFNEPVPGAGDKRKKPESFTQPTPVPGEKRKGESFNQPTPFPVEKHKKPETYNQPPVEKSNKPVYQPTPFPKPQHERGGPQPNQPQQPQKEKEKGEKGKGKPTPPPF
jgi:uncharacterized protein DUF6600